MIKDVPQFSNKDLHKKRKTTINFSSHSQFQDQTPGNKTRVLLDKVSCIERLTMNEPQASGLANSGKFRKHSIEEKRKRSKLRKKTEKRKGEKS